MMNGQLWNAIYLTTSFILLKPMLTVHSAHLLAALIALTDFTVVVVPLEAMLTEHGAHDI